MTASPGTEFHPKTRQHELRRVATIGLEHVANQNVSPGVQDRQRLVERLRRIDVLKALAEEHEIKGPVDRRVFEPGVVDPAAVAKQRARVVRQNRAGRHAVDLVPRGEQVQRKPPGTAADIEHALRSGRDVGLEKVRIPALRLGQIARLDRQPVREVPVVQVLRVQKVLEDGGVDFEPAPSIMR